MGTSVVTGPTVEPITLAELRTHLRIDAEDDDALLASLIFAAREWIEGQTKRVLTLQTLDFTWDHGWPHVCHRLEIRLPVSPVSSVTSVSYVDEAGVTQTLSAALYTASLDSDTPRIVPAYNADWPTVRDVPAAVTVRAVCGYGNTQSDVPEPLRLAVKMHVEAHYDRDERTMDMLMRVVESLISPYRRVTLL